MKYQLYLTFSLFLLLLFSSKVEAVDFIIHIDNSGNALFFGSSDKNISLPYGVYYDNGKIRGQTYNLTSKNTDIWTFNFYYNDSEMNVYLPPNSIVLNTTGEVSLSGTNILIYSKNNVTISYSIEESTNSTTSIYYFIIPLLIICIVLFYLYRKDYFKRNNKKEKVKTIKKPVSRLNILEQLFNEKERLIVNTLREKGKVKSNYLRKICDLPKSSFFRHIIELENKKIIKRSGEGRNKLIELIVK